MLPPASRACSHIVRLPRAHARVFMLTTRYAGYPMSACSPPATRHPQCQHASHPLRETLNVRTGSDSDWVLAAPDAAARFAGLIAWFAPFPGLTPGSLRSPPATRATQCQHARSQLPGLPDASMLATRYAGYPRPACQLRGLPDASMLAAATRATLPSRYAGYPNARTGRDSPGSLTSSG